MYRNVLNRVWGWQMDKESYHDFGKAPLKAEGEPVDHDYQPRTPEDTIKYLQERMAALRKIERRYNRLKTTARQGRLMIANKEGFTLVEDLDEYLTPDRVMPLSKADLIRDALGQMEEAFGMNYKAAP